MRGFFLLACVLLVPPAHAENSDVGTPLVAEGGRANAPIELPNADGNYLIDLLVLYTASAGQSLGGIAGVSAEVARLTALANTYFINSHMPVEYRVAGVAAYSGEAEKTDDYYENQQDLADSAEVRAARGSVGADLVILFRAADSPGFCGLSVGFNGGELATGEPANVASERDAFIVVGAAPGPAGASCPMEHTFAHELGHALGGGHQYFPAGDIFVDVPVLGRAGGVGTGMGRYWRTYAHAIACTGSDGTYYWDIMAGNTLGVLGQPKGDFFSNPDLLADGQVCGSNGVPGTEITEANNARAMTEAAPYVAAYRGTTKSETKSGRGLALGGLGLSSLFALLLLSSVRRCPAS